MGQPTKLHVTLKSLMEQRKIGLRELAKQTKVPPATLSSYINRGEPGKVQHLRALAKFFSTSIEFLVWGEESERLPSLEELFTEQIFSGWLKVKIERAIPDKRKAAKDDDE